LTVRVNRRWDSMTAARATGETAALRAIALDDSLAEAHAIVGMHRAYAYDFTGAARHIGRAVELRPRDAWLRERMAFFYLGTDRPSQGLEEAADARQLDPLSPTATAVYAVALLANDRCDEALALLKSLEALDPPLLRVPTITARCLATKKRWAEAIALLRTPAAHDGGALSMLGWLLARSGARAGADSVQRVLELRWRDGELGAYLLGRVPAGLGDRDEAFMWLNRAYEDRSLGYSMGVHLGLFDPVFRDLRSDPRFSALRKRLGL